MIERAVVAASAEVPAERTVAAGWWLLGVTVVAQAGFSVLEQGIPLMAGFIRLDLDVSATVAGVAVSSFVVGKIIGSYVTGWAADVVGERLVLVAGGVISAVLVVVATLLPTVLLFLLLVVAGIGNSAATPAGGRLVILAFPRRRYGLAQGIRQTGVPLGGLVAALLLPWIAQLWSWRWSLAAAAALTVLAVAPLMLPGARERRTSLEQLRPARADGPIHRPTVRLLTLWGSLLVSGQFTLVTFLAPDLHERIGISLATASLIVAVALLAGVVGRVGWGMVSDMTLTWGRKWLLTTLTGLGISSSLVLLALPGSAPVAAFLVAAAFAGVTLVGYQAVWFAMLAEAAGPSRIGAATGFAVTFVLAAAALTPPLFGAVADLAGTYRAVWAALAVVLAMAFVPAILVNERQAP